MTNAVATAEGAALEVLSPFLADLLEPSPTIDLEDATRTYRTMDVVEPCQVYDPLLPNTTSTRTAVSENGEVGGAGGPGRAPAHALRDAHAAGQLWQHFARPSMPGEDEETERRANQPPRWFEQLCRDLFFRTSSESDGMDAAAAMSDPLQQHAVEAAAQSGQWRRMPEIDEETIEGGAEASSHVGSSLRPLSDGPSSSFTAPSHADDTVEVDPFLWLPFDLRDEKDYDVGPYTFSPTATYTDTQRTLLCLGDVGKEYVHFANTYAFPERYQLPTSLGTVPAKLYVDPSNAAPVVYLQLSPDFPPAMWLPIKGTASSVRRVVAAFAQMSALHRDWYHDSYVERYETAQRVMQLQRLPLDNEGDVLRFMAFDARNAPLQQAPLREFRNHQELFLGEYDDPERLLEHLELCPFLFSIPHLRTVTDPHAEHMIPTIEGPGVALSAFRCIYSKAVLAITVQLSAEVKLPPQDPETFQFLWSDSQVVPKVKIPVFARVIWPDNTRLCGGGQLNRRLNHFFGTEFAPDIPVDAVMALFYVMNWAKALDAFMGVRGMRQRVAELEAATHVAEAPKLYPGTRELPNPEYTVAERLGMHVQYLSQLGDPDIAATIENLLPTASAAVRMGCAKAALIAGERELFHRIVSTEPPGRMQHYMTKLVRKRKTRDLIDPEPRLLDEQYEFAAPLWTKKGVRVDRNTLEGAVDAAGRLAR